MRIQFYGFPNNNLVRRDKPLIHTGEILATDKTQRLKKSKDSNYQEHHDKRGNFQGFKQLHQSVFEITKCMRKTVLRLFTLSYAQLNNLQ